MFLYNCPLLTLSILTSLTIVLSTIYIAFIVYSFVIKKWALFIVTTTITTLLVFLVQVFAVTIHANDIPFVNFFKQLHISIYIVLISLSLIGVIAIIIYLQFYNKKHITSNSIIQAFNTSKDGFLYFEEDGSCLLINKKMEEIASSITKTYILNGYDFLKLIKDKIITLDNGSVYKFIDKVIKVSRKPYFFRKAELSNVYELIALDVTELFEQNRQLELDNKKLKQLNNELIQYNKKMLEVICHREILETKQNIHNEMNELVLQSAYLLDKDDQKEKAKILSKWENNAYLLSKEGKQQNGEEYIQDLLLLADTIGIKIVCDDYSQIFNSGDIDSLFIHASKESLTNIAKHTKAKRLIIEIEKNNGKTIMRFINENNENTEAIKMGGGLTNLCKHVEQLNGKMLIENKESFILTIEVPDAV